MTVKAVLSLQENMGETFAVQVNAVPKFLVCFTAGDEAPCLSCLYLCILACLHDYTDDVNYGHCAVLSRTEGLGTIAHTKRWR